MSTENWTDERERLVKLLEGIDSGTVTHVDEEDFEQLQATNPGNIVALRARLSELNSRLGASDKDLTSAKGGKRTTHL